MNVFYKNVFFLQNASNVNCKKTTLEEASFGASHDETSTDIHKKSIATKKHCIYFRCEFCKKSFRLNHSLNMHTKTHHSKEFHLKKTAELDSTQKSNINVKSPAIEIKKSNRAWNFRLISDGPDNRKGKKFTCEVCNKSFDEIRYLKRHVIDCVKSTQTESSNSVNNRIDCHASACAHLVCKRKLPTNCSSKSNDVRPKFNGKLTRSAAATWTNSKTTAKTVKKARKNVCCSTCKDTFHSMDVLIAHQTRHIIARPFICRYCDRTFSNKGTRTNHEKVHGVNENIFDTTSREINKTPLTATDLKTKFCFICKKQYIYYGAFKTHMRKKHSLDCNVLEAIKDVRSTQDTNVKKGIAYVDNSSTEAFKPKLRPVVVKNKKENAINNQKTTNSDDRCTTIGTKAAQINCGCCRQLFVVKSFLILHLSLKKKCNKYYERNQPGFFGTLLKNQCWICDKVYSSFSSRRKHLKRCHKVLLASNISPN